jgi:hypothetical protein
VKYPTLQLEQVLAPVIQTITQFSIGRCCFEALNTLFLLVVPQLAHTTSVGKLNIPLIAGRNINGKVKKDNAANAHIFLLSVT